MKLILVPALLFLVLAAPVRAQNAGAPPQFKPIAGRVTLNDGDTVVFLGDSITHQCLYTQYVEDYCYTRYPAKRIRFHNAGVGGDRAADALARFDQDVAAFHPKYVTLLLGMNDGRYTNYNQDIFDTYQRDMATLLDRIAGLGALAVPMTPTMHDARAARVSKRGPSEPRDTHYNGVLALFGAWLREQAHVRGLGFVDMYSPLNNLTLDERRKDPMFTLIRDAVHPDAPGQVVMAVAVLNDLFPKSSVSAITVAQQPNGKRVARSPHGTITDFQDGEPIRFTFLANSLPWVLPPEAAEGWRLTRAGHRFSNEKLTVPGLKPGRYELRIDGQPVGAYTDAQLARGIELQENDKTPQYQQALQVALLNKEKNDQAMRPLRNLWRDRKLKRAEETWLAANPDHKDASVRRAAFEKWLADFQAGVPKLLAQVRDYEDRIYQINQPRPRRYELAPVK